LPIAWNPDPFPTIGSPPILPVARDPNPIRVIVIIILSIVTGRGIVPSVIDRRGRYPYGWRSNKNPEMAIIGSKPGKS
jgi:hypothetical protein